MGGGPSNRAGGEPMLDTDIEAFAGVVFHDNGVFVVAYNGTYQKTGKDHWSCAKVALPDGRGNVVCLHDSQIYVLPFATSLSSHKIVGRSMGWGQAQVLVRQPSDRENLICFHGMGVYKIKVQDGSYTKLSTNCWSCARAAVMNPDEPGFVYIFHSNGLYKVSLADGGHVKIGSYNWDWARAAVYLPRQKKVLLFHTNSIYRVDLADGSSENVNVKGWSGVKAAVLMKDDPDTVLVIHEWGIYHVKVADGSFTQVSKDQWAQTAAFAPLGEDAFVSCRPCNPQGANAGAAVVA